MRFRRTLYIALLAVPAMTLPQAGIASTPAPSATGNISGSGTTWSLAIANTGSEPIRCFQLQVPPPVLIKAPGTAPSGWQLQTNGQVLGGQSTEGLLPGGTGLFTFPTTVPYPSGAGGTLRVSATCAPGSDVTAPVTGPAPTPPPKPAGCACKSLFWTTGRVLDGFYATPLKARNEAGMTLRIANRWALRCVGKGGACTGTLTFRLPAAQQRSLGLRFNADREGWRGVTKAVLVCKSRRCDKASDDFAFDLLGGPRLGFGKRGVTTRSVTLWVIAACGKKRTRTELTFVFGDKGDVDWKRSDLNGNDVPDGREAKFKPGGQIV